MNEINFKFTDDGVNFECKNVSGADIVTAFMILAKTMREDGVPKDMILAAARGGINDKIFNKIMAVNGD